MGVVVVDTGLEQNANKVVAAIRKLTDKPIQYIMNTHMHPDHMGGNIDRAQSRASRSPALMSPETSTMRRPERRSWRIRMCSTG